MSNIKKYRLASGLSTLQVANYLNTMLASETNRTIDYRNVWAVEKGERRVPVLWLKPLSELYGCTSDDLIK